MTHNYADINPGGYSNVDGGYNPNQLAEPKWLIVEPGIGDNRNTKTQDIKSNNAKTLKYQNSSWVASTDDSGSSEAGVSKDCVTGVGIVRNTKSTLKMN